MTIRALSTSLALGGPRDRAGVPSRQGTQKATTPSAQGQPRAAVDGGDDLAALSWDLTIHGLYRAFADCLEPLHEPRAGRAPVGGEPPIADVRLAATRHALRDIDAALLRVEAGTYGVCDSCGRSIARQRLRAAPTTVWCAVCARP